MENLTQAKIENKFKGAWHVVKDLDPASGGGDPAYLNPDGLKAIPAWVRVKIKQVWEAETKKGVPFLWVRFWAKDNAWQVKQAYFSSKDLSALLEALQINELLDPSQLEGREICVKLSSKKVNSQGNEQEFVRIEHYSLNLPKTQQPTAPVAGSPIDGGEVPF